MKERHQRIYDIVNARGSATVEQLTREIFASEATIRRDLTQMEQKGLLHRVWGGAISINNTNYDPPAFVRSNTNINAKKQIARKAISFMHSNMSLFVPSGTTVTELAKLFNRFTNLTVITTGLDIINVLSTHSSAKVIILGGELYESYDFTGMLTSENINKFTTDLFFFSCSAITADGFTSNDMARLEIINKMQRNSAKTILLVDTSKVGKKSTYKGFGFEYIDYVVMEKQPKDKELVKVLGKKLIVAQA